MGRCIWPLAAQAIDAETKGRIEALEARQAAIETAKPSQLPAWLDRITLSVLLEIEASMADLDGEDESDIVLATAELGIEGRITEEITAQMTLLAEEEDDAIDLGVDEGYLRYGGSDEAPLHETQYGACASYTAWDAVTVGLEYLHGENADGSDEGIITLQLAAEF